MKSTMEDRGSRNNLIIERKRRDSVHKQRQEEGLENSSKSLLR
jgi:hypothetical protein